MDENTLYYSDDAHGNKELNNSLSLLCVLIIFEQQKGSV